MRKGTISDGLQAVAAEVELKEVPTPMHKRGNGRQAVVTHRHVLEGRKPCKPRGCLLELVAVCTACVTLYGSRRLYPERSRCVMAAAWGWSCVHTESGMVAACLCPRRVVRK